MRSCNIETRIQIHRNRQRGKDGAGKNSCSTLKVPFNIVYKLLEKNSKQIIDSLSSMHGVMSTSMRNIVHNYFLKMKSMEQFNFMYV